MPTDEGLLNCVINISTFPGLQHWTGTNTTGSVPESGPPWEAPADQASVDGLAKRFKIKPEEDSMEDSEKTLETLYTYRKLQRQVTACNTFERGKVVQNPVKWVTDDALVGIEIEVENIKTHPGLSPHWIMKPDGSLRNNGMEFVSIPLQVKQIQIAVESLYLNLNACNSPDFSNRTSTHIHLNVRDMTRQQIETLIYMYCVFEKHFYSFAGHRRLNSIFCVPIFRTNMLNSIPEVLYSFSPVWHKYCGLNLLPLLDHNGTPGFGTIEFRHLYGTNNPREVLDWINNILCLRKAAMEIKLEDFLAEVRNMNTTSSYMSLYSQIFGEVGLRLSNKQDFEECVSNLKRELWGKDFQKNLTIVERCKFWEVVRKLEIVGEW